MAAEASWAVPRWVIVLLACLCLNLVNATVAKAEDLTRKREVLQYLREHPEFLLDNPDLLQRALELHEARRQRSAVVERQTLIQEEESLLSAYLTPVRGQVSAEFTLIEFSDYQCVPCKRSFPAIETFLQQRDDVRLIILQLPVYGHQSTVAARAALFAQSVGKFERYHAAMMQAPNPVTMESIETGLESAGVDVEAFHRNISNPVFQEYLERVKALSISLSVTGTPTFLLNGVVISGGVDAKMLDDTIKRIRRASMH